MKHNHVLLMVTLVSLMGLLAICGICAAQTKQSAQSAQSARGSAPSTAASAFAAGAGGAEEYAKWLSGAFEALRADLPAITASAEAAAKAYLPDSAGIAAQGDLGFTKEINNRAGGIIRMQYADKVPADFKGVILAYLREDTLDQDVQAINQFHTRGCHVVVFGGGGLLDEARKRGATFDSAVNTRAADHDGLFRVPALGQEPEQWSAATAPAASILAAWTWQAEFVAACTRLNKMPPMFQSYAIPGSKERFTKLKDLKFHETTPPPVPAGVSGKAYLHAVETSFRAVMKDDLQDIRDLAALVIRTRKAGGKAYFFAQNHAQLIAMSRPHEGPYLQPLNANGYGMRADVQIGPGDLIFASGYSGPLLGKEHSKFRQQTLDKGATLAWTFAAFDPEALATVPAGQIVIDQHWSPGDAVVEVPGYDIKIIPASGVMAEAVLGAVNAEVHSQASR